jgi:hypothetical protein
LKGGAGSPSPRDEGRVGEGSVVPVARFTADPIRRALPDTFPG